MGTTGVCACTSRFYFTDHCFSSPPATCLPHLSVPPTDDIEMDHPAEVPDMHQVINLDDTVRSLKGRDDVDDVEVERRWEDGQAGHPWLETNSALSSLTSSEDEGDKEVPKVSIKQVYYCLCPVCSFCSFVVQRREQPHRIARTKPRQQSHTDSTACEFFFHLAFASTLSANWNLAVSARSQGHVDFRVQMVGPHQGGNPDLSRHILVILICSFLESSHRRLLLPTKRGVENGSTDNQVFEPPHSVMASYMHCLLSQRPGRLVSIHHVSTFCAGRPIW